MKQRWTRKAQLKRPEDVVRLRAATYSADAEVRRR
jgi:hypothetical protein